jgi:hypothetical protein
MIAMPAIGTLEAIFFTEAEPLAIPQFVEGAEPLAMPTSTRSNLPLGLGLPE